jgi:hypothetical protein
VGADGAILPVVLARGQMVTNLSRLLRTLGLKALPAEPESLQAYLRQREHAGS